MAMSSGPNGINVTPLIDVLLVLLVIFMVAMPVVLRQERVDVPPKDSPDVESKEPAAQVKLKVDGSYDLDDIPIMATELATRLRVKLEHAPEQVVFVDFEDGVPWREVVATVDLVRGVGSDSLAVAVRMHPQSDR
jgi:biopolymer transport protein ExbD